MRISDWSSDVCSSDLVAERALMRLAVELIHGHDAEGAGRYAIAAAVADVLLHDHGVELGAENRAGRAGFQTGRGVAVLAHVAHHQPARSEEHTSELQSLMRISYAVLCLKNKTHKPK